MKYLILILLFVSCNKDSNQQTETRTVIVKTEMCTVEKGDAGTVITCPDGSSATVKDGNSIVGPAGARGETGVQGEIGKAGSNCTVLQTDTGATILCDTTSVQITNGADGNSIIGPKGEAGADGINCTVEQLTDGATVLCGEKSITIKDGVAGLPGERGADGEPGLPGSAGTIITPVIPCPTRSGAFPEVLLCIDNTLYAVFVGSQTRYAAIPAGSYQTTDGRYCNFRVESTCTLSY
jgi:hypothetical protein